MNDKLIKAATNRYNRKQLHTVAFNRDFDDLINQADASKIIGQSRALYHNNPLVRSAIDKKASYSIGNAFEYRSKSKDKDAKIYLEGVLRQWSKVAEVSGKTLNDCLWLMSTSIDTDGDIFVLLSETKTGYPVIQLIEAHAIASRHTGRKKKDNLVEEKGVLYDSKTKRPLFYRILGETEAQDQIVSVKNIIRISEPSFSVRGTPLVSSCVRILQDIEHSQELLLTQHLMASSISMIEHNETGTNNYNLTDDTAESDSINVETINNEGGEVRFFKSGTGGKIEFLQNNNPSIPWQEYQNTLTNLCLLALDWPKNLVGMSDSTGVNDRVAIQQAQKTCLDRQVLLTPYIQHICNWVISKLAKNGFIDIELPNDWYECYFTRPKFVSVDLLKDSKANIEEYKMGFKTLSQILAEEGLEYETQYRERLMEEAIRIKLKQEIEKEYGVTIDDTALRMLSPTQFQQTQQ